MKSNWIKIALVLAVAMFIGASHASATSFSQCPAVGNDTNGCELLVTVLAVNGSGAATSWSVATASPDQGPYDGVEDTLIGIVNSSGQTLNSISFSGIVSGDGIFDFDGDGACAAIGCTNGAGDTSGYGGPNVFFSNIGGTLDSSGTVNFKNGLTNGSSAWFSLEEQVSANVISQTPEPGTLMLFGSGLVGIAAFIRRKLAR